MPLNKEFVRKQVNQADANRIQAYANDDGSNESLYTIATMEIYYYWWKGIQEAGKIIDGRVAMEILQKAVQTKINLYIVECQYHVE